MWFYGIARLLKGFNEKKVSPFKLLPVNCIVGIFVLKNQLFVLKDVYLQ